MVQIRGEEVLLPTTIVGSYPRPMFLRGKVFPVGGVHSPEFPSFEVRSNYRNAVALALKDMTDAGLDVVTDGAQHYESESDYEQGEIFHFYMDRLEGLRPYGDPLWAGQFENNPVYKPTCDGPIGRPRPIFKPIVEAAVEQTDKPVKIQAAVSPATTSALITDKHYGDVKALSQDLARADRARGRPDPHPAPAQPHRRVQPASRKASPPTGTQHEVSRAAREWARANSLVDSGRR
jgi:5-methyltetrahydropteroyltriglutamate--homocysteine methyltransferase